MKKFYLKHKNQISLILNVLILIIGIYTKNYPFIIVGIILFALTFYVAKIEEKKKAERDAERKALKAQQKRLNKGKKKKKKKKR